MNALPVTVRWDGESFVPASRREALECDRQFVVGEKYRMTECQDRSAASHNHEFAWLATAWQNLPEDLADEYPSPEHLRKRALIEAKFYTEQLVDAGSNAAAERVAQAFRSREQFVLVLVRGPIVIIRTPESQSRRSMGAKRFQESKSAIMEVVCELIGISPDELEQNAGKAA